MTLKRIFAALCALSACAAPAAAQTVMQLPRNDVSAKLGWSGSKYAELEPYDRWHSSLFSGLSAGHYWIDHLKTEVEVGWFSRVNSGTYAQQQTEAGAAFVRIDYRIQTYSMSISQLYQFGRNAWVHPFVGAGADINSVRTLEDRPAQSAYLLSQPQRSISLPAQIETHNAVRLRPVARVGVKVYASEHAFFTTEWKLGFGGGFEHVIWNTGVGVDF